MKEKDFLYFNQFISRALFQVSLPSPCCHPEPARDLLGYDIDGGCDLEQTCFILSQKIFW